MSPMLTANQRRSPEHVALAVAHAEVESVVTKLRALIDNDAGPTPLNNIQGAACEAMDAAGAYDALGDALHACEAARIFLNRKLSPFDEAERRAADAAYWAGCDAQPHPNTGALPGVRDVPASRWPAYARVLGVAA